jgi:hypothetical protein
VVLNPTTAGVPGIVVGGDNRLHMVYPAWPSSNYRSTLLPPESRSSTLSQALALPANLHRPTLSFWYQLEATSADHSAGFSVSLANAVTSTVVFSSTQSTAQWTHAWVDLSNWAGQAVTLTFEARIRHAFNIAALHLDEVSIGSWLTPVPQAILPNAIDAWTTTVITVTGQNFISSTLGAPDLYVGDQRLADTQWISPTMLVGTAPALAPGHYDLRVVNPEGQEGGLQYMLTVGDWLYLPITVR